MPDDRNACCGVPSGQLMVNPCLTEYVSRRSSVTNASAPPSVVRSTCLTSSAAHDCPKETPSSLALASAASRIWRMNESSTTFPAPDDLSLDSALAYASAAAWGDIDIPTLSSGLTVSAEPPLPWRTLGSCVSVSVSGLATSNQGSTADSRSKIWTRLMPSLLSRTTAKNHNGYFVKRGVSTSVTSTADVSCFCVLASRCATSNDPESIASTGPLSTVDSGFGSSSSIAALRTAR